MFYRQKLFRFIIACILFFQIEDDAAKFGRPLGVRTVSVIGGVRRLCLNYT